MGVKDQTEDMHSNAGSDASPSPVAVLQLQAVTACAVGVSLLALTFGSLRRRASPPCLFTVSCSLHAYRINRHYSGTPRRAADWWFCSRHFYIPCIGWCNVELQRHPAASSDALCDLALHKRIRSGIPPARVAYVHTSDALALPSC